MADHYKDQEAPKLNICYFDIEVDFNKEYGFAEPADPFNPVTAIGMHFGWLNTTVCLAMKPSTMTQEEAERIVAEFDNVHLMDTEEELLQTFLRMIEDADILTGWNSETYDIPYLVNRVIRILDKDSARDFCLWDRMPKSRKFERFSKEQVTFDLVGRVHLDYLQLYRKYTYHEMHSYSLDAIAEHELGERKIPYEGTLDQLYHEDFPKFLAYNIQDTELIKRLDTKLQYIDQANLLAHANTVTLQTTMGSVSQIDQAIINQAHEMGLIVPNNKRTKGAKKVAGAWVANPKTGLHHWIGSMDLDSLYPSIIRSLNMSLETVVGQVRQDRTNHMIAQFEKIPEAWEGKFSCIEYDLIMAQDEQEIMTIDFENGEKFEGNGKELYELIFNGGNNWCLSANATIMTLDKDGIVPILLTRWFAERRQLQAKAKALKGNPDKVEEYDYWDKRQLIKKIVLNSTYGAILNEGSRFFDQRIGQSVTLSGRCIARHMAAASNQVITGQYNHEGDAMIYGDTDGIYFSAYPTFKDEIKSGELNWTKDHVVAIYDEIGKVVNDTFTEYMQKNHNCPEKFGSIIAASREIVGESGLFITKKRYGILVYDDEGKRMDSNESRGKTKIMGLEIKRSDTPQYMQDFLKEILQMVLEGATRNQVFDKIRAFRLAFRAMKPWEKGTPKRVNNLTNLTNIYMRTNKCHVGHALAAIHYNNLLVVHDDRYSMRIADGMKTIVCQLKNNPWGMTAIGIPTDEKNIPKWFQDLPFDEQEMEYKIVTKKLENLLHPMGWDLTLAEVKSTYETLFEF